MTRIKESPCPTCGALQDAITCVTAEANTQPKPGDITFCSKCTLPHKFDNDLNLAPVTLEDFQSLDAETRAQVLLLKIAMVAYRVEKDRKEQENVPE